MAEEGITVLTGEAQAAARGELHGEMHLNVAARDAAVVADALPEGEVATHQDIETKHYSDGTSATGPGPLPDMSPEQQAAAEASQDESHIETGT